MPGIFRVLHIPGIFAGIKVFLGCIEQDFVQNHEVSGGFAPWTPILMLNIGRFLHIDVVCRRVCDVHFATISIFRKSQVFFRGNYAGPPVGLHFESSPWVIPPWVAPVTGPNSTAAWSINSKFFEKTNKKIILTTLPI